MDAAFAANAVRMTAEHGVLYNHMGCYSTVQYDKKGCGLHPHTYIMYTILRLHSHTRIQYNVHAYIQTYIYDGVARSGRK